MATNLYYFKGTGNSLKMTKDISKNMGNCEYKSIPKMLGKKDTIQGTEVVGLIFPEYYFGVPQIVMKLIEKINFRKNKLHFCCCDFWKRIDWWCDFSNKKGSRPKAKSTFGRILHQNGRQLCIVDMGCDKGKQA